ncbi:MAG: cupredoxin domain-containing protein [Nanoarchaeota archaeon]
MDTEQQSQQTHTCSKDCTCAKHDAQQQAPAEERPQPAPQQARTAPAEPAYTAPSEDDIEVDTKGLVKIIAMVVVAAALAFTVYAIVTTPTIVGAFFGGDPVVNDDGAPLRFLDGPPQGEMQKVTITMGSGGRYQPYPVKLKAGVPVEFKVDPSIRGCVSRFSSPELGLRASTAPGENLQYFVPQKKGTYQFACPMGMGRGIIVVE